MESKLMEKIMARLPKSGLTDPGDLELHFLTGSADLAKFAKGIEPAAPPGFADAVKILKFIGKFSNFPNLLKKKSDLEALFTDAARQQAEVALLSVPYLGLDTSARYYFLPAEFRIYWALVIGAATAGHGKQDWLVKKLQTKKLIKNKEEFGETLARIR